MQNSIINDARQQQITLNFEFLMREHSLIIKAESKDGTYQAAIQEDPDVDFNEVSEMLLTKQYHLVSKRYDILKLTVGALDLEFTNTDKLLINELRQRAAQQQRLHQFTETELNLRGQLLDLKQRDIQILAARLNELTEREQLTRRQLDRINTINEQQNRRIQQLTEENATLNRQVLKISELEQEKENIYVISRHDVQILEQVIRLKDTQILYHEQKFQQFKQTIHNLEDQLSSKQQFASREIDSVPFQSTQLKTLHSQRFKNLRISSASRSKSKSKSRVNHQKSSFVNRNSSVLGQKYSETEQNLTESNDFSFNRELKNHILKKIEPPKIARQLPKKEERSPNPQIEKRGSSNGSKKNFYRDRKLAHSRESQKQYQGILSRNQKKKNQRQSSMHSKSRSQKDSKEKSKGQKKDFSKDSLERSLKKLNYYDRKKDVPKDLKISIAQQGPAQLLNATQYVPRLNFNQLAKEAKKINLLSIEKNERQKTPVKYENKNFDQKTKRPNFKRDMDELLFGNTLKYSVKNRQFAQERIASRSPIPKNVSLGPPKPQNRFSINNLNNNAASNKLPNRFANY